MTLSFNQTNGLIVPIIEKVCDCPKIRARLKIIASGLLILNIIVAILLVWWPREEWPSSGRLIALFMIGINAGIYFSIMFVRN